MPTSSILGVGGVGGLTFGLAAKDVVANFLGGTMLAILRPFTLGEEIFVTGGQGFRGSGTPSVSGAFYTLVPVRPRRRGERRSLRALPVASLRPPPAFNPDTPRRLSTPPDAFQLHPDDAALYGTTLISPGENGTAGVAVVGIGGYKNEEQLKSAPHWSKVYSGKCLPNDDACEEAPEANKFGALMCDFDDLSENARAECWTVTTSGAFYTLVPIRPRRRGGRRSLRILPVVSLRSPPAFNPRPRRLSTPTDAYELQPDIRLYGTALREARDGAYEAKLVSVPGRQVLPRRGTAP